MFLLCIRLRTILILFFSLIVPGVVWAQLGDSSTCFLRWLQSYGDWGCNNLKVLSDWFVKTQTIGGLELLELLRHIYVSLHKWSFIMQKFSMIKSSIVSRERERKRETEIESQHVMHVVIELWQLNSNIWETATKHTKVRERRN